MLNKVVGKIILNQKYNFPKQMTQGKTYICINYNVNIIVFMFLNNYKIIYLLISCFE